MSTKSKLSSGKYKNVDHVAKTVRKPPLYTAAVFHTSILYNEVQMTTFNLASSVRNHPKWPYEAIKTAILGKTYYLSLAFIGETRAQKINLTYRKKDYVPNVLSFTLDDKNGEIFICPEVAKRQAKDFKQL